MRCRLSLLESGHLQLDERSMAEGDAASKVRCRDKREEECANFQVLGKLPPELWQKITDGLESDDLFAFAMTCRFFREKQKGLTWCDSLRTRASRALERVDVGVREGRLDFLKFIFLEGGPYRKDFGTQDTYCTVAARNNDLGTLKWLRSCEPPCEWEEETLTAAAEGGHIGVLEWLRSCEPPCPWYDSGWTCSAAARAGQLDALKWLRAMGCPWAEDGETCAMAAEQGRNEVLRWLRARPIPCPYGEWGFTVNEAADNGHLETLKLLRSLDPPCPWNAQGHTCTLAARGGHRDVLAWLRASGCPWRRSVCRSEALTKGHLHVIHWIDRTEDESDAE